MGTKEPEKPKTEILLRATVNNMNSLPKGEHMVSGSDRIGFRRILSTLAISGALFTVLTVVTISEAADESLTPRAVARNGREARGTNDTILGKGNLHALVVGVSKHSNPKLCLDFAAKDARDFADFIQTQKKVFKNTYVKLMVDDQANKQEIEKYLFHDLIKAAGKDDTVILFFSGHGAPDAVHPDKFYFVTSNADPEYLEATALNMTGLKFLDRLDSQRVLLITDACHAGMPVTARTKSLATPLEKFTKMFTEATGRFFLASSKPEELSQEKPGLQNGVFTHYLLKGLRGEADSNRDGVVTVDEAYDFVYERTKNETKGAQHPFRQFSGGPFPMSVLGKLDDKIKLDVWFVAQDSRCANPDCMDPKSEDAECKDPLCGDTTVENGSALYSGQNFQIGFRPHATSYVYVYQIDTSGNIVRMFPGTDFVDPKSRLENPLEGGRVYWLPGKERWFRLDKTEGQEKIYVVASRSRNASLEDLYKSLEEATKDGTGMERREENRKKTEITLMTIEKQTHAKAVVRHGPVFGPKKERSFEELSHMIESAGLDAVESVWFHHKGQRPGR